MPPTYSPCPDPRPARRYPPPSTAPPEGTRWRVFKLGGTSVADTAVVRRAARLWVREAATHPVAVVVSALSSVTDQLSSLLARLEASKLGHDTVAVELTALRKRHECHLDTVAPGCGRGALASRLECLGELLTDLATTRPASPAERVEVLAQGERLSAEIVLAACQQLAGAEIAVESRDPGELLVAEGDFEDADVDLPASRTNSVLPSPLPGRLWVLPGFFARGRDGRRRLLGRGGSDTSATLLGAVLDADRVEIWTDVDGVFQQDPRRVAGQEPFARLGYERAERLATEGARVLHAKSLAPARAAGLPIWVRNSFRPEAPGTWIERDPARVTEVAP